MKIKAKEEINRKAREKENLRAKGISPKRKNEKMKKMKKERGRERREEKIRKIKEKKK